MDFAPEGVDWPAWGAVPPGIGPMAHDARLITPPDCTVNPTPLNLRRRLLAVMTLLPLAHALPAIANTAPSTAVLSAMASFEALYLPALTLTRRADQSPEGPAKADAAMQRLLSGWSARRVALAAAMPGAKPWAEALDAVGRHLTEADLLITSRHWVQAHAALDHVRESLLKACQTLGLDYVPGESPVLPG